MWNTQQQKLLSDDIETHIVEIPKLTEQWHEEKVNPWKDPFARWLLLLSANEDEHLTKLLEDIAMNQDLFYKSNKQMGTYESRFLFPTSL